MGEQIHQHQRQPDQQRAEIMGPPPQGDAGQAKQQQIFRSSGPIQATENRQRIAVQISFEHPRCSLGAFAIPEQWIEPTAEHQQPADAEAPVLPPGSTANAAGTQDRWPCLL